MRVQPSGIVLSYLYFVFNLLFNLCIKFLCFSIVFDSRFIYYVCLVH